MGQQFTSGRRPVGPEEIVTEPLSTAIDAEEFTPRLLSLLSNALVWAQTQRFLEETELSTNDWRVLSALATHPGRTASEISDALSINKATLSGAANRLAASGLLVMVDGPRGSRPMYLTPAGVQAHDRLVPIARRGQHLIDDELDDEARSELNALLRRLTERARRLNED